MNENFIEYIKHIAYELGEFATAKKGLNKEIKIRISQEFQNHLITNYDFDKQHFNHQRFLLKILA